MLLSQQPAVLLYVAALLARRLDLANRGLIELKGELAAGAAPDSGRGALGKIERCCPRSAPATSAPAPGRR